MTSTVSTMASVATRELELELKIGDTVVKIQQVGAALAALPPDDFLAVLRNVVESGGSDGLKLLINGLEIQSTPSAFDDSEKVRALEATASEYPFSRWLEEMDILPSRATRESLCEWWETFMTMAGETGFRTGQIDTASGGTGNLWKATGPLASQMLENPAKYRFLPALLANHPQEVARVLHELRDPEAFLELLTGETIGKLRKSPKFLGSFSTVKKKGDKSGEISRGIQDAIYSVSLALQRKSNPD